MLRRRSRRSEHSCQGIQHPTCQFAMGPYKDERPNLHSAYRTGDQGCSSKRMLMSNDLTRMTRHDNTGASELASLDLSDSTSLLLQGKLPSQASKWLPTRTVSKDSGQAHVHRNKRQQRRGRMGRSTATIKRCPFGCSRSGPAGWTSATSNPLASFILVITHPFRVGCCADMAVRHRLAASQDRL